MKLASLLLALLLPAPALAGVPCTLPFNLQNGQVADATQVMANYNALVTCLGSAAAAGANSDITSLSALTTPLPPSLGGTSAYVANATSTGSANAQVVAVTTPANYSLVNVNKVVFKAGFTNTGATTLNVNSTGALSVFRRTTGGITALVGGEIIQNGITEVVYDGTQYQLMSNISPFPVGTVLTTIASTADPGFLLLNGSCQSTTTFATLWAKMGSPAPGSCSAGQFALPDGRGRVVAMIDSGGSARITVAGGNFDGTVLYASGGLQNATLTQAQLPTAIGTAQSNGDHAHSVFLKDNQHNHRPSTTSASFLISTGVGNGAGGTGGATNGTTETVSANITIGSVNGVANDNQTATTGAHTHSVTNAGGGSAHAILQPTLMLNKQVKY